MLFATTCSFLFLIPTFLSENAVNPTARQREPAATLWSFDELQARLGTPDLRLLDVRSKTDYDRGHLPGAVWVDTKRAATLALQPNGLFDKRAWDFWISGLGLTPEIRQVRIVDGGRQLEAARIWWLLTYLGVANVGLVDGNVWLWRKEGRPMTTEIPKIERASFPIVFQEDRLAIRQDVLKALKSPETQIVDARSPKEFTGEFKLSRRGGRIPRAKRLEWTELVDQDGRFTPLDTVRGQVSKLIPRPTDPVVIYCQVGLRASVGAFTLERLEIRPRLYFRGWLDWGNTDDTPIAPEKPNEEAPRKDPSP
jgi:thiosulfate/3-mercaptopyruvate sulfurtransferase